VKSISESALIVANVYRTANINMRCTLSLSWAHAMNRIFVAAVSSKEIY
jgi:hypothetical protein